MIALLIAASAALHPVAGAAAKAAAAPAATAAAGEIWMLDQVRFRNTRDAAFDATLKALEPDHTMEAVVTRLALRGIAFTRAVVPIDTSKVPAALLSRIGSLPPTEPFVIPAGDDVTINLVLSRRPKLPPPPAAPARRPARRPAARTA